LLLKARSQPDYYRKFYIRRALRIFPAYLVGCWSGAGRQSPRGGVCWSFLARSATDCICTTCWYSANLNGCFNNGLIRRWQVNLLLGLSIPFLICSGIAVGIAWLSRRYVEEPFLRLKSRLAP